MKFNRLLYLIFVLGGVFLYNSCRKLDSLPEEQIHSGNAVEDKFFKSHRSTDFKEKALVDFIKRENNKERFIEKTVSQIGYPRWDKILSFKKPDNKKGGRGNSEDSVSIFYIPFVRDSQHFVNASLIIKTQPNDTTFYYICDWQYQNKVHGSPTIDTTAERYAVFFMILDNRTFGNTEFNITDTDLFTAAVPSVSGEKKLGFVNISTPTAGRNSLMEYHEICVDFYVCGTPQADECYNGCDYLTCPSGECFLVTAICDGWWEETGGGGGGSGSGGGTGGGSGGGGDSGNGGSTPPDCDGATQPLAAKNNLVDPCTGGWEPIPIDDEPGIMLPPYVISDLTKPCLKTTLNKLSGGSTNTFFKQVYNIFNASSNLHLFFVEDSLPTAYGTASPPFTIPSGLAITITMDTTDLLSCSQEWMAYVFIHEIAHAAMFANIIQWDSTNSQHDAMMFQFLTQMATSLTAAYPGLSLFDAYSICYTGFNNAIDGIASDPSLLYIMLKQVKSKLNDLTLTAQQLVNRGEDYNETGTRGLRTGCN